jgi:hypothetical protein
MRKHLFDHIEQEHRGWFVVSTILIGALYYFYLTQSVDVRTYFLPLLEGTKYSIDGELIIIHNGSALTDTLPRKDCTAITIVGTPLLADLNGDGLKDITFLLEQTTSRGQQLSYIAYALRSLDSYVGSNTVYLGKNIDPEILLYDDKEIMVNYVGKHTDIGRAKYYIVRDNMLTEVARTR